MRGLAEAVVRAPRLVLTLTAVLTGAAGAVSVGVGFDSAVDIWFLDDDPELRTYERFKRTFATDELLVVGVFAPDVFDPSILAETATLADAIGRIDQVHAVRALTNAVTFSAEGEDGIGALGVYSSSSATVTRARALADPLIAGLLVAPDGRASAMVVELSTEADTFEEKVALVQAVKATAATVAPNLEIRLGGTPAINEAIFRYSRRDFSTLGLLSILLILGVGFVVFRRISLSIVPLAVVVVTVVWLFGVMGLLGWQINLVSQSLVSVVLAVGIADAIHVLADYRAALAEHPKHDAIVHTLRAVALPCLFTTLTTVAGMLSLTSSHLAPIREFGILAAIGVTFAFVVTFTALPAALAVLPAPVSSPTSIDAGLDRIVDIARRHRFAVATVFVALMTFASWRVTKIDVGANPVAYFKTDDPVRHDIRRIDEALGGSTSIELLVETQPDGLADPAVLERLQTLEAWLETKPSVSHVLSITDALAGVNRAMTGENEPPKTAAGIAQAYLLLEDEPALLSLVNDTRDVGRASARVRMTEAAALVDEIPAIEKRLAEAYDDDMLRVKPTGFVKLIGQMEIYIVDSQVRSFLLALAVVSVLMVLLLRSFRLGVLAMIPNLVPVAGGLAVMELAGIRLDPGTAMIGSITLGLVVDDTVHLLSRIAAEHRRGVVLAGAATIAVRRVGRPIVTTSIILVLGFGVLAFGSFTPNIYLGIVAATVVLLALICDLLVVPALIFVLGGLTE